MRTSVKAGVVSAEYVATTIETAAFASVAFIWFFSSRTFCLPAGGGMVALRLPPTNIKGDQHAPAPP